MVNNFFCLALAAFTVSDQLRQASFKGLRVEAHELSCGARRKSTRSYIPSRQGDAITPLLLDRETKADQPRASRPTKAAMTIGGLLCLCSRWTVLQVHS